MSGWCHAASARWPTVLITISVPFQLRGLVRPPDPAVLEGPARQVLRQRVAHFLVAQLFSRSVMAVSLLWFSAL